MKSEQQKSMAQQSVTDTKEAWLHFVLRTPEKSSDQERTIKDDFLRSKLLILFVNVSIGVMLLPLYVE